MTKAEERAHEIGRRRALLTVLRSCLAALGYDEETKVASVVSQLEEARMTLRTVCEEFGDNDWSNDLHLSDVIENHLARPLREGIDE